MRGLSLFAMVAVMGCAELPGEWEDVPLEEALEAELPADMVPIPPLLMPALTVGQVYPGDVARFTVQNLNPGETAHIGASTTGTGQGPCPPQAGGLCVDILGPVTVIGSVTEQNGSTWGSTTIQVPVGLPIGSQVHFQAVAVRGPGGADSVKSNAVSTVADQLMCILLYDPVCGIDGVTYSNSCFAGVAGWPVDYQGPC